MNERDELAEIINGTINDEFDPGDDIDGHTLADAILAAGYRRPRTVTSNGAVQIWEDSVGDSGKPPTDEELAAFANAVLHEGSAK